MLSAFIDNLKAGSTYVYSPNPFVLLCGGEVTDIKEKKPTASLRDAFLKSSPFSAIKNAGILQIEEIREYFDKDCPYKELVTFERDIAQMSDLVLLFSESPGSFTELGVFTSFKDISRRLLLIIQNKHLQKASFISQGPVAVLRKVSDSAVFSITNKQVGIRGDNYASVKPNDLLNLLKSPMEQRLKEAAKHTTLQKSSFSHRCQLYVALLREFTVLKDDEIITLFAAFDIKLTKAALNKIAFCCKGVQWARTAQAGFDRVHFATDGKAAAKFSFSGGTLDPIRRRLEFRDHWAKNDPARLEAQIEAQLL